MSNSYRRFIDRPGFILEVFVAFVSCFCVLVVSSCLPRCFYDLSVWCYAKFSRVRAFSSRILSDCDLLPLRKTDLYCSVCLSFLFSINTSFLSSRFDILMFTRPGLPFPLDFKRVAATTFTDSFIELTSSLAIASISSLGSWIMFVAMIVISGSLT